MPSLYFLAKVTYTLHSCKFREVILGSRIILLALVKSQRPKAEFVIFRKYLYLVV